MIGHPNFYSKNYWRFILLFLTLCGIWVSPAGLVALVLAIPFLELSTGLMPLATALSIVMMAGGLEAAAVTLLILYLYHRIGWKTSQVIFLIYGGMLGCLGGAAHSMTPMGEYTGIGIWFFVANGACSGLFVSFMATRLLPPKELLRKNKAEFERRMIRRMMAPLALSVLTLMWWLSVSVGLIEDSRH